MAELKYRPATLLVHQGKDRDPATGAATVPIYQASTYHHAGGTPGEYDYARSGNPQRPFMMSRSGSSGIQRFGAAMWSGDIGARLSSLAAHSANQMHMSLSGIDYYGSDIGGFHRNLEGDLDDMYTRGDTPWEVWKRPAPAVCPVAVPPAVAAIQIEKGEPAAREPLP